MRIHILGATPTSSGLSSSTALYSVNSNSNNNNNNKQKLIGTMPSSISRPCGVSIQCGVRFRPCIDIHQEKIKQIVGSTLRDLKEGGLTLVTNFESDKSAAEYANPYKEDGLTGGHIILLGADALSKSAAIEALHAFPGFQTTVIINCGG